MMDVWGKVLSSAEQKQVRYYELHRSYRSTKEIMDYARGFWASRGRIRFKPSIGAESLWISGEVSCGGPLVQKISSALQDMEQSGCERRAILCRTLEEAERIAAILRGQVEVSIIRQEEDAICEGVVVLPVYFAKGLEFDGAVAVELKGVPENSLLTYIMYVREHCISWRTFERSGRSRRSRETNAEYARRWRMEVTMRKMWKFIFTILLLFVIVALVKAYFTPDLLGEAVDNILSYDLQANRVVPEDLNATQDGKKGKVEYPISDSVLADIQEFSWKSKAPVALSELALVKVPISASMGKSTWEKLWYTMIWLRRFWIFFARWTMPSILLRKLNGLMHTREMKRRVC
ncbi:MAG: hypothetical protein ACLR23_05190 [Clostridia bacterium]